MSGLSPLQSAESPLWGRHERLLRVAADTHRLIDGVEEACQQVDGTNTTVVRVRHIGRARGGPDTLSSQLE